MRNPLSTAAAIVFVAAFSSASDATAISLSSRAVGTELSVPWAGNAGTPVGAVTGVGAGALGIGSGLVNNKNIDIVGVPNVVLYVLGIRANGTGGCTGTGSGGGTGAGTGTGATGGTGENAAGGGVTVIDPPVVVVSDGTTTGGIVVVPTDPMVPPVVLDGNVPSDPAVTTPQGGTGPTALTAAVPEPATAALLVLGVGGLALAGMRRRK